MAYALRYHPDVRKQDIPRLDRKTRDRVRHTIEQRLVEHPEKHTIPLRRTLQGYRKLRIGDYRVVLKIVDATVTVLAVCHRKDVYRQAERRAE